MKINLTRLRESGFDIEMRNDKDGSEVMHIFNSNQDDNFFDMIMERLDDGLSNRVKEQIVSEFADSYLKQKLLTYIED
jgi:transcriptional regulator CtsR